MSELTIRDALAMVETGLRAGSEIGAAISIAIIDGGGNLLAFARMDGALLASLEVSQVKARTALFFGTETRSLPFDQPFTPALIGAVSYPSHSSPAEFRSADPASSSGPLGLAAEPLN